MKQSKRIKSTEQRFRDIKNVLRRFNMLVIGIFEGGGF